MKTSFLVVLSTLLLPIFAYSQPQFEIKWGTNHAPYDYFLKAAQQFKENVEKRSNQKIKVTLVTDINEREDEHFKKFKSGEFQISQTYTRQLAQYVPEFSLFSLPYLFTNDEHVTKWISTDSSKRLLAKLSGHNIRAFGFTYSGGFAQVFGDKMNSFADYANKTVATDDADDVYERFIKSNLKASIPEKTDVNEVLPIRSTKLKYQESIMQLASEIKKEKLKRTIYLNMTGHRVISRVLFISEDYLKKMPADLQKIVLEEGAIAAEFERTLTIQDQDRMLAHIKDYNVKMNVWSKEKKQTEKQRFADLYKEFKQKYGAELINEIENINNTKVSSTHPNF